MQLLVILGLIVAAWLLLLGALWLHRPARETAVGALRLIPDIARTTRNLLRDPATPGSVRLALGGLLVYLVLPIDLVPEFVPVVGSLDDVIVARIVLRWVGRRIGLAALADHWSGTPEGFALLRRALGI